MRGLALAARDNGYTVSGLDESAVPPGSTWLDEHNIIWWPRFDAVHLDGVTKVIITGAHITPASPVILEAAKRDIPVQSFAEFFGEVTEGKQVVAVAGTHGKTTTSALITWLLESAGRQPDFLIGIRPFNFDTSVRLGQGGVAVVEADEYHASSLHPKSKAQYYHPDILVLTSVEHDHPDVFPDLASVQARFREIVGALPKSGTLIACLDGANVAPIASAAPCLVVTYGDNQGNVQARNIAYVAEGIELDVEVNGQMMGHLAVSLYGKHNVLNVLGAVAAAMAAGLTFDEIIAGAASFKGAYRRFNVRTAPTDTVVVVDDYAHHPTEVATNIQAAQLHYPGSRVIAVLRPHTYSRTKALMSEYHAALAAADVVYVTDVEGAREAESEKTVSGQDVVAGVTNIPAYFVPDRDQLITDLAADAKPGDVVLCFTVSGYNDLAGELARTLPKAGAANQN